MEYISNSISLVKPYIILLMNMIWVWVTITNSLTLYCKLKYSQTISDLDIHKVSTSVIILLSSLIISYVM